MRSNQRLYQCHPRCIFLADVPLKEIFRLPKVQYHFDYWQKQSFGQGRNNASKPWYNHRSFWHDSIHKK